MRKANKALLSIIIPAYNEENTISIVVSKIKKLKIENIKKEIIIVDDGSLDGTFSKIKNKKGIKILRHKKNKGKGSAVITGIKNSKGEIILIQDADLEYNPLDIPRLIKPILNKKVSVVYGTRLRTPLILLGKNKTPLPLHFIGNRFLSFLTTILYGQYITDMETGYKVFERSVLKNIKLKSRSFDFEPEITAKILKKKIKILELNIKTKPRGYKEGKKIRPVKDGLIALKTLVKYRFLD
jgi:glycosyltransferase involved in cell wall biosynthesis